MASPSTPDLAGRRELIIAAGVVTALVCALLLIQGWPQLGVTVGDSDDALRLQRVRDLLAGDRWFDQRIERIQPPEGGDIHWSRLLDAALAGMVAGFDALMGRAQAETWTRALWPLLWVGPTVAGALVIARSLGGGRAVFLCGLLIAPSLLAFVQFAPGRIDHHNIQIALAVTGLAGAVVGGGRGAMASAVSAALGLAIGVEALIFQALIGASFALRWMTDPREQAGAKTYSVLFPVLLLALYAVQTSPERWAAPACDAVGANLLAAVVLASAGLWAAARFLSSAPPAVRVAALLATGAAAAGAYAGLQPACLGGPLGAADPRLGPVWLDHVEEVQTIFQDFRSDPAEALAFSTPAIVALLALGVGLLDPRARREPAWLIAGAFLLLGAAAQAAGSRMTFYPLWAGLPILAAVVARAGERWWSSRMLPSVAAVLALSPMATVLAVAFAAERILPAKEARVQGPQGACFASAPYAELARLPAGDVLAPVYLGSHLVALTPHAALAAPYHRMSRGILASAAALGAEPAAAEPQVRALGMDYVVTCPALAGFDPDGTELRSVLDRGAAPPWLERLSGPGSTLQIYRVRAAR